MILKLLRTNPIINRTIRNFIVLLLRILSRIQLRWRVSGISNHDFDGLKFSYIAAADDVVADSIFYNENYAQQGDVRLFIALSKRSKVILDIGSNTGLYTILAAKSHPESMVYSFEPHPANFRRLTENIALNKLTNIQTLEIAAGAGNSAIDFYVPEDNSIVDTSSALKSFSEQSYGGSLKWRSVQVRQTSIDNFVRDLGLAEVNFIKIDVEGFEQEVLRGCSAVINKSKPVFFCEAFINDTNRIFFNEFLSKNSYTGYLILQSGLVRLDNGLIENRDSLNFLFAREKLSNIYTSFKEADKIAKALLS